MPNQSQNTAGITRFHSTISIGSAMVALSSLALGVFLIVQGYSISKGSNVNIPFDLKGFREIDGSASGALAVQNPLGEDLLCGAVTLNVASVNTRFNVDIGPSANATTSGVTLADNLNLSSVAVYSLSGSSVRQNGPFPRRFLLNASGSTTDFVTLFSRAGTGAITGSGVVSCMRMQ